MFWVALATAIMMLSGEGDDTRAVGALIAGLRDAVARVATEPPRKAEALRAVSEFERAFATHRAELQTFGRCVEAADRDYYATRAAYTACRDQIETQRHELRGVLGTVRRDFDAALAPEERAEIAAIITRMPQAWVLDPSLAGTEGNQTDPRRGRGLEGVAAERHLTLPRNVVLIAFGPLGPATFGQRYPSKIIDAGTSYAHTNIVGTNAGAAPTDAWFTRLGVRFGLFDDFEAGALFLPLAIAPDFRFDPVLVFLTQQIRCSDFDIALRLSFQTPGDTGWAFAPGALLGKRGRRLAVQTGLLLPMEVGTFRDPRAPLVGLHAPLRAIWNIAPSFFVSADSGFAYDDFSRSDGATVPLGFGSGYTWLAGSKLVEFTGSFTWDHWLLAGRPSTASVVQLTTFRAALGATLSFQAL